MEEQEGQPSAYFFLHICLRILEYSNQINVYYSLDTSVSNIRHKDFVLRPFIINAQATRPGFLNGVDWRALVKD